MKRLITMATALAIAIFGIASPAVAGPKAGPAAKAFAEGKDQAFSSLLDQLVAKGTITAEQAMAINEAMKAKKAERQAKLEAFASKADAIIASVLGMSLEKFKGARANRTLPTPTADQKAQIRAKLNALAASLGLPKAPAGPHGHGKGPHRD